MKLQSTINEVEGTTPQETNGFSIEASAKAFLILSDGLYSNKIKAVVRELSTNAYDSHIEAGCPEKPFFTHIPNGIEPWFSIRDYGTGLSHEDCMQLYTTYFRSTKNNSNDAVGCLGLGSKSPFAYTDSFIVESFYNGTRSIYNGYKGANGCPEFDLMDSEPTTEPNGLLVKVPVKMGDFSRFESECYSIYKHFKVKPETNDNVPFVQIEKQVEGDDWYYSNNHYENLVVMGQVAYPINSDEFEDHQDVMQFLESIDGLVLELNIGDVDITPSRESLSYNKQTVSAIVSAVERVANSIEDIANESIADCDTLYEARIKYIESEGILKKFATEVNWNGEKLFDDFRNYGVKASFVASSGNMISEGLSYFEASHRRTYGVTRVSDVEHVSFSKSSDKCKFIFIDEKKGHVRKIRYFINNTYYSGRVYCFEGEKSDFLEFLGNADESNVTLVSTLEEPPITATNVGGGIPCKMYDEDEEKFVHTSMSVKYENAYYIPESKNYVEIGGRNLDITQVEAIIKTFQNMGFDFGGTFYTVKPNMVYNRKLNSRDNWSDGIAKLEEIFKESIEDYKDDFALVKSDAEIRDIDYYKRAFKDSDNEEMQELFVEHDEYLEKKTQANDNIKGVKFLVNCFRNSSGDINAAYVPDHFKSRLQENLEEYKFLPMFNSWSYREHTNEYVAQVDEIRRLREKVQELENQALTPAI